MLVTSDVLKKFGPNSRLVKEVQPSNMLSIIVTVEVSNFESSRAVNEEQLQNMNLMLKTARVSKFDTSRAVNAEHA